jgi:hypothetical protein
MQTNQFIAQAQLNADQAQIVRIYVQEALAANSDDAGLAAYACDEIIENAIAAGDALQATRYSLVKLALQFKL